MKNFKKLYARRIDKGAIARNRSSHNHPLITKLSKPKRQSGARSKKSTFTDGPVNVETPVRLTEADNKNRQPKRKKTGFYKCKDVGQVAKLLQSQNRKLRIKGFRALKGRAGIPRERICYLKKIMRDFPFCGDTNQINGQLLEVGFARLHTDAVKFISGGPACLVTLIDGRFTTSHLQPRINLVEIKRRADATLRQMAPNYLACIEFALYNSHKHPTGGRVLSYHVHAIIWGGEDPFSLGNIVAEKRQAKFEPNFSGADPIRVKRCETTAANLARVLGYMMKAPHECPSFYPGKNGRKGNTHHSPKGDRHLYYLRLLQLRSLHTWDQMMFGKGEGAHLRRTALKQMKDLSLSKARVSENSPHADEVLPWWADLYTEIKIPNYKTPVIIARK
ncbi:hypothetical protein [Sphingobium sp. B8D3A]|nr:hypothetical protein [Sphingobium sp. B8D3A]MCW2413435.1 hypothetical protein [Sphingobium sp. B8D3D]